jgi:hypothetical protein
MKNNSLSKSVEVGSFDIIASRLKSHECLGPLIQEPVRFSKQERPLAAGKYLPFRRDGEVVDGLNFENPQYTFFKTPAKFIACSNYVVMLSDWECEKNNGSCLEITLCSRFGKKEGSLFALVTISYVSLTEIGIDREIVFHPFSICENFGTTMPKNHDSELYDRVLNMIKAWITETVSILESD